MAGILILALALAVLLRRGAPFEFLEGYAAVTIPKGYERLVSPGEPKEFVHYSFKADFDSLKLRAKKELIAAGYRTDNETPSDVYLGWPEVSKEPMPRVEGVMIFNGIRNNEGVTRRQAGWVEVVLQVRPNKSFFGRIADWLGF